MPSPYKQLFRKYLLCSMECTINWLCNWGAAWGAPVTGCATGGRHGVHL